MKGLRKAFFKFMSFAYNYSIFTRLPQTSWSSTRASRHTVSLFIMFKIICVKIMLTHTRIKIKYNLDRNKLWKTSQSLINYCAKAVLRTFFFGKAWRALARSNGTTFCLVLLSRTRRASSNQTHKNSWVVFLRRNWCSVPQFIKNAISA